jgi:hypothetical protein
LIHLNRLRPASVKQWWEQVCPANVILLLGFANLVADSFAMAASNYSGTKAD